MSKYPSKFWRVTKWLAVNAGMAFALAFGVQGHPHAWNIFVFVQWFTTIAVALIFYCKSAPFMKDFPDRTVPSWIDFLYDVGIALTLAAFAHFGYASMSLIQFYLMNVVYSNAEKSRAEA